METKTIAVLLAGGESTRFWPFKGKITFSFQGQTFLYWHYEQLLRAGIKKCYVIVNETTHDAISSITAPKELHVEYITQKGQGMGSAVRTLKGILHEEPILIVGASESYSDTFISKLVEKTSASNECILGAVKVSSYFPGGYLKFNTDGTIAEIIEKPEKGSEPSDTVTIVADYFPHASLILDAVEQFGVDPTRGYENALSKLIQAGTSCKAEIAAVSDWCPIKYPWHVLNVMNMLFSNRTKQYIHPSAQVKEHVIIEGPVYIEEGVKISEGTKIVGPCYIGKNTIIGNNNLIRYSHIGADCATGFNTDITRSYIGNDCWFHTNYIGDSVIGNNVSMGSGTVCANLRLDDGMISSVVKETKIDTERSKLGVIIGNDVRLGVNVSTMPGVKIGSGTFIAAGVVVSQDIAENSFVRYATSELIITPNKNKILSSREEFRKVL